MINDEINLSGIHAAMNAIESAAHSANKLLPEEKIIQKHCDLPADIGTCNNFTQQWYQYFFIC